MPSKLRKAIGAVKDQTSISLAKVSGANTVNIEIPILKATSHDEVPIDNRYINDILQAIGTNKVYAALCAQVIGKRVTRTRNWIVALKSLLLVLRIFQHGDPNFPREVLHAMKTGSRILNLSNFRDDSNSSPWDFTAFVRTFALYLDERLDCLLSGKLHRLRRCNYQEIDHNSTHYATHRRSHSAEPVRDMKPATLIDRISFWQKLLDRAIATKPTGEAKTNRLIQTSLHAIVQESFDLYRDISDGLALLLDSFFHLQYQSCVNAFQACVRASKQFEELSEFYGLCKGIGVGRTSEYPSVQKISDELIEALQEFLKDQASFPSHRSPPPSAQTFLLASVPMPFVADQASSSSERFEASYYNDQSETSGRNSLCTSPGTEDFVDAMNGDEEDDDDNDNGNAESKQKSILRSNRGSNYGLDFLSFDYWPSSSSTEKHDQEKEENSTEGNWEIVLFNSTVNESTAQATSNSESNGSETCTLANLFDQHQYNNPFLQEGNDFFTLTSPFPSSTGLNGTTVAPTFRATVAGTNTAAPTFCASNPSSDKKRLSSCDTNYDPFESFPREKKSDVEQSESFVREQQMWLEQQKKIIAKRIMS